MRNSLFAMNRFYELFINLRKVVVFKSFSQAKSIKLLKLKDDFKKKLITQSLKFLNIK